MRDGKSPAQTTTWGEEIVTSRGDLAKIAIGGWLLTPPAILFYFLLYACGISPDKLLNSIIGYGAVFSIILFMIVAVAGIFVAGSLIERVPPLRRAVVGLCQFSLLIAQITLCLYIILAPFLILKEFIAPTAEYDEPRPPADADGL